MGNKRPRERARGFLPDDPLRGIIYEEEKVQKIEIIKYNILFVGEANIGTKTSLIKRMIEGKFIEIKKNAQTKCESLIYKDNYKEIRLYLIDTIGEKEKRDLANIYYKNVDCIIMGYDITNKSSFQELIDYWHNQIKKLSKVNLIYLLANKIDLINNREVREKEGKLFADVNNFKFFSISVKNDINIQIFINDLRTTLEQNRINKINNGINEIIIGNPSKEDYKIVLIGDSGVGSKTSLMNRIVTGQFDDNIPSTKAPSYASKSIQLKNDKTIKLDMWDTGGEEQYRSLIKFFLIDADCIIMGYDVTNPNSFESIKSFWYNYSKENSVTDLIYLIGNKIDLYEDRIVEEKEALQYCEENNLRYFEISCLFDRGIEKLIDDLSDQLVKR